MRLLSIYILFFLMGSTSLFAGNGGTKDKKAESTQQASTTHNSEVTERLNGRVKNVKIVLAGFGDEKTNTIYEYDRNKKIERMLTFNGVALETEERFKNGILVERLKYHQLGHVSERETFKYDAFKRITNYKKYNSFNKVTLEEKTKYDKFGNKVEHLVNGQPTRYRYHFDKKKNLVELAEYNDKDEIIQMDVFWYDEFSNRSEWGRYNGEGRNLYKILYKYDYNNRLVQQTNYGSTGEKNFKKTIAYNLAGDVTQLAEYDGLDSLQFMITYEYREDGSVANKTEYFADGTRTEYTYEFNSNITKLVFFSAQNEAQYEEVYRYTYDEKNNWVRKTKVANQQEYIVVRAVEYY